MNLSFFIDECKNGVLRHKILTISLAILFLSSTMCGIVLVKPAGVFDYYLGYCDNYVYKVVCAGVNPFSILMGRCLSNILFFIVVCMSSCVVFLFPLQIFNVFYRGFVFGIELFILCTCYSVNGFFIALLLVFPQNIILGGILVLISPFCIECGTQILHARSLKPAYAYLSRLLFFLIVSLAAAILELFTVVIIFRPFAIAL